jgi:hypothetical protein
MPFPHEVGWTSDCNECLSVTPTEVGVQELEALDPGFHRDDGIGASRGDTHLGIFHVKPKIQLTNGIIQILPIRITAFDQFKFLIPFPFFQPLLPPNR